MLFSTALFVIGWNYLGGEEFQQRVSFTRGKNDYYMDLHATFHFVRNNTAHDVAITAGPEPIFLGEKRKIAFLLVEPHKTQQFEIRKNADGELTMKKVGE